MLVCLDNMVLRIARGNMGCEDEGVCRGNLGLGVAVGRVGVGFAEDLLITFTGGGLVLLADSSTTSEESSAFLGTQKAFCLLFILF